MKSNLKYAILLVLLLFITNVNAITIPRNTNYKYGYPIEAITTGLFILTTPYALAPILFYSIILRAVTYL